MGAINVAANDPLKLFVRGFERFGICRRPGCEHRRELTIGWLLRAFGPDATLGSVVARMRCSKCGSRGTRIEARYMGRHGDGR
jgi:hypothetical protein